MRSNSSKPSSDAGFKTIDGFATCSDEWHAFHTAQNCKVEKDCALNIGTAVLKSSGDSTQLTDKQAASAYHLTSLMERHRAPNGVPTQAKTWVGGEDPASRAIVDEIQRAAILEGRPCFR